jgi:hypothetical protein
MDAKHLEDHVDAAAALIGLPIAPEHRAGVVRYLGIAAGMAEIVMAQPMHIADETAEVFVPVSPERP